MSKLEVLFAIEQADDLFMNEILETVIKRYSLVFPEWEVMFLALKKEPQARAKMIDAHIRFLEKMKKESC